MVLTWLIAFAFILFIVVVKDEIDLHSFRSLLPLCFLRIIDKMLRYYSALTSPDFLRICVNKGPDQIPASSIKAMYMAFWTRSLFLLHTFKASKSFPGKYRVADILSLNHTICPQQNLNMGLKQMCSSGIRYNAPKIFLLILKNLYCFKQNILLFRKQLHTST